MRKRSKKRIPQDIRAWNRVITQDEDEFFLPVKKVTRWTSGNRRNIEFNVLNAQNTVEKSKVLIKSFINNQELNSDLEPTLLRSQLQYKLSKVNKLSALYKNKHTCFFQGKGRTYNRQLFVSRHTLRKMSGVGLIAGLQKS